MATACRTVTAEAGGKVGDVQEETSNPAVQQATSTTTQRLNLTRFGRSPRIGGLAGATHGAYPIRLSSGTYNHITYVNTYMHTCIYVLYVKLRINQIRYGADTVIRYIYVIYTCTVYAYVLYARLCKFYVIAQPAEMARAPWGPGSV